MKIEITSNYRSLQPFVWNDIPKLAIVTGRNGSGKSHLLEAIYGSFHNPTLGVRCDLDATQHQVAFSSATWQTGNAPEIDGTGLFNNLQQFRRGSPGSGHLLERAYWALAERAKTKYGRELSEISEYEMIQIVEPNDAVEFRASFDLTVIAQIFVVYHTNVANRLLANRSRDEIVAELGEPPWVILNNILSNIGFRYEFTIPLQVGPRFKLQFKDRHSELICAPNDLSSGEQAILGLVSRLYGTTTHRERCKLMLLDEPDAHLHTTLIRQYLATLDLLATKHDCKIIMTTHRPDTIAIAPGGSLFELIHSHGATRVNSVVDRDRILAELTGNVLLFVRDKRVVFVEDANDGRFYCAAQDIACRYGILSESPLLVFQPSPLGASGTGGKTRVETLTALFAASGLSSCVRGLIDKDIGNLDTELVKVLARHSIENYLCDPLVIYCAAVDAKADLALPPTIRQLGKGNEYMLRSFSSNELQELVDAIAHRVAKHIPDANLAPKRVSVWLNSTVCIELIYPQFFLSMRGHDLLNHVTATIPSAKRESLLSSFERLQVIPDDIVQVLKRLK